ncbi:MAG TPA: 50S ribosomal protein L13 [Candidatus Acidoferrales bacterium]|nr:50S ribosomal protein L13 [Candidatus Acidoferrales bacterium]
MTERMRTYVPSGREAEELAAGNTWYVVDAAGQVLGRLAVRVARVLMGKDKPVFTPSMDTGDHVIVINADKIRLTGNKMEQKVYQSHSGYPGGWKEVPVKRLKAQNRADRIVREAILGMLPKNKLQARRARKLRVYLDAEGLKRHTGQKPQPLAL